MHMIHEPGSALDSTPLERLTAVEEVVEAILQRDPDFAARIMEFSDGELNDPLDVGKTPAEVAWRERVELAKQELLYRVLQATNPPR